jgi:hypothetical protein
MKHIDEYTSITAVIERLIERENETIAIYEQMIRETGESVVTPLLRRIVGTKNEERSLLERELEELNEQFEIDEAII